MRGRARSTTTQDRLLGHGFIILQLKALVVAVLVAVVLVPAGAQASTGQHATLASGPCGELCLPYLTFAPSTNFAYDFGQVEVGQTASQLFTLVNAGTRPTTSLSLTFGGSDSFDISDDACSMTNLRPGGSCTFELAYVPAVVGVTDTGTVTATGHKPNVTAALNVSGFALSSRHVYWTNQEFSLTDCPDTIGRANVYGTLVNDSFINGLPATPFDVAVDSSHLYWTDPGVGAIGRANLDGTGANQNFITGLTLSPKGLAVDSSHIYWTWLETGTGGIGRANLDGTNPDPYFIYGVYPIYGLAVDSTHIYWTDAANGTIVRASLDGLSHGVFINDLFLPSDVAVDSGHVYWTTPGAIGRANLTGTTIEDNFITGANAPDGLALDSTYIYWTSIYSIGRANLDGTDVSNSFITGLNCIERAVAVDAG